VEIIDFGVISLMIKFISIIITIGVFAACNEEKIRYPEGGYKYVEYISKEDSSFWYLPAKDSMPSDDSFEVAYYSPVVQKAFDEPNISLRPADIDIFRFYYEGLDEEVIIITLTRNEIVIKKKLSGGLFYNDRSQLTSQELFHLDLLNKNFPLHKKNPNPRKQRYLDSLVKIYPRLLDVKYYAWLSDKVSRKDTVPFSFSTKKYRITTAAFNNWVDTLNASGYWKYPYDHKCESTRGTATHMAGYILESNTRQKYNVVRNHTCPCDTSAYVRACQQLVTLAGVEKETILIWGCD
jgi:hypothetical protein